MTITFDSPLGTLTMHVADADVMSRVEALHMLGFSPVVSLDNPTE